MFDMTDRAEAAVTGKNHGEQGRKAGKAAEDERHFRHYKRAATTPVIMKKQDDGEAGTNTQFGPRARGGQQEQYGISYVPLAAYLDYDRL